MNRPRKKNRHLPRCVYLQHGAYYRVKGGVWTRLGATLQAALAKYAALYATPKGSMPEVIARAMPHIVKGCAVSTAAQYRQAGNRLAKILFEYEPDEVKPKDIAAIKRSFLDHPNMSNRIVSVARLIFDYLLEEQLVESNPAIGISRYEERKRTREVTAEEYDAIYPFADARLQIIMDLLRITGQRIEDVLPIRRPQLTADGIAFLQKKTGKFLTVKWTDELHAVVDRALALHGKVPRLTLLFNRRGKRPDYRSIALQFSQACVAAGVQDCHLHDLRAVAALAARRQGKDPTKLLGHSSAQQTKSYLRDREPELVEPPTFRRLIDTGSK